MRTASPQVLPVLVVALKPHRLRLIPEFWRVLETGRPTDPTLLPVAGALASYDPDERRWNDVGPKVSDALVAVSPVYLGPWLDALRPGAGC